MQRLHDIYQGATSQAQDSSPDTTTSKTLVPPQGAIACEITVETTAARVTWNGTTPSSTNGLLIQPAAAPLYQPFAKTITWRSSAGTASIVNVLWLF